MTEYDPAADFASYDTFDWADNRPGIVGKSDAAGALDTAARRSIGSELVAKGMVLEATSPELLVIYYVGADDAIDAGRWGYRYGAVGKGWGGNIDVRAYRTGALVVDLIDAAAMRLVWRASAEDVFRKNDTPEAAETRLREAVRRLMESFPPAR